MTERQWIDIFSGNLRELIVYSGMTQKELADASGLSEITINKYINGRTMPSVKGLLNLVYALNCDFTDLIDFGDKII